MIHGKEVFEGVEWRIRVADGSSEVLVQETGLARKAWLRIKGLISGLAFKVWMFLKRAWDMGVNDPKKLIHCIKVGLALAIVSLFYFMRPLYDGVGGNAMWAVMTVVVVFEQTVGKYIFPTSSKPCRFLTLRGRLFNLNISTLPHHRRNPLQMFEQSLWNLSSRISCCWAPLGCQSIRREF